MVREDRRCAMRPIVGRSSSVVGRLAGLSPFQIKSLSALASEPVSSLELVEAKAFLDQ